MKTTNLTNHFIIAMPSLMDDNFNHTVTYICEHNENGSFGIVINRITDVTLDEVIHQMDIDTNESIARDKHIYHGGPVQQERGFILHTPPGSWSSSLKINDHLALTTSRDILEAIAQDKGPEDAGHDGSGDGHDAPRTGQSATHRPAVVMRCHPLLVHTTDQEHLVVAREAEQDREHHDRQEREDRSRRL